MTHYTIWIALVTILGCGWEIRNRGNKGDNTWLLPIVVAALLGLFQVFG